MVLRVLGLVLGRHVNALINNKSVRMGIRWYYRPNRRVDLSVVKRFVVVLELDGRLDNCFISGSCCSLLGNLQVDVVDRTHYCGMADMRSTTVVMNMNFTREHLCSRHCCLSQQLPDTLVSASV